MLYLSLYLVAVLFAYNDCIYSGNGKTYQLRALDFDTDGPFKDYPQITVYHPSEGYPYANVGWPGTVGLLTGFSSQQLGISEIGVSFPDDSFGQGTDNTPPEVVKGQYIYMYIYVYMYI